MLGDFSNSSLGEGTSYSSQRRPRIKWLARELVIDQNAPLTRASDLYSFARMVVEAFTGRDPFDSDDAGIANLRTHIIAGNHPPRPTGISDDMWSILEKYWSDSPENRGSAEDIIHSLSQPGTLPAEPSLFPSLHAIFDCTHSDSEHSESEDYIFPIDTQKQLSVSRDTLHGCYQKLIRNNRQPVDGRRR